MTDKTITVYVSIDNGAQLPQVEWAAYAGSIRGAIRRATSAIHGEWVSLPWSSYQAACWCLEIAPDEVERLKRTLGHLAEDYRQDSVAWAVAETELISGSPGNPKEHTDA
jgi:hypothetical protein